MAKQIEDEPASADYSVPDQKFTVYTRGGKTCTVYAKDVLKAKLLAESKLGVANDKLMAFVADSRDADAGEAQVLAFRKDARLIALAQKCERMRAMLSIAIPYIYPKDAGLAEKFDAELRSE